MLNIFYTAWMGCLCLLRQFFPGRVCYIITGRMCNHALSSWVNLSGAHCSMAAEEKIVQYLVRATSCWMLRFVQNPTRKLYVDFVCPKITREAIF